MKLWGRRGRDLAAETIATELGTAATDLYSAVARCTGITAKRKPCTLEPETDTDRCIFHPRDTGRHA